MLFENIINVFTLIATVLGLLGCLFKYIKSPRRGYLYLIIFFLFSFLSDYYWTIYTLVMGDYPEISEFLAYIGWNVAYVILMLAVIHMRKDGAKKYFHPIMFLPIAANAGQLILYLQFGGIFNNIWQVGFTTATMVFCVQDIAYYVKNRKQGAKKPHLSIIVLIYLLFAYGMWTSSCFDFWPNDLLCPYIYCAAGCAVCAVLFARNAGADYEKESTDDRGSGLMEYRFQMLFQAIVSVVIFIACGAGYIIAVKIKEYIPDTGDGTAASNPIIITLFIISIVLILLVLLMVREIRRHYQTARKKQQEMDEGKRSTFNFVFTMAITLALMVFIVFYNSRTLYKAQVTGLYEDGDDIVVSTATEIENYMIIAETTLRVTADTVDMMEKNGNSPDDVRRYLTDQTNKQFEMFDESFTGIYAYYNGEFMDGSGWVPPDDYDPVSREWYSVAADANGEIVIVSPYIDAQTKSVVITFAKAISNEKNSAKSTNVVALDIIVNHIQSVTENVDIAGKGYAMVVNADGFIVAHKNTEYIGQNVADIYGVDNYEKMVKSGGDRIKTDIDGEACELFVHSVLGQWTAVIVIGNAELYENIYSQLAVNIIISLMTFLLISYFYYFGYKIEQNNSKRVEALNMQVVSALAEAVDAKDTYTNGHSSRVAKYAKMIAARAGYSPAAQNEIYMMGLLHDVGKIGVPDDVINSPGKLTDEEYEKIKEHPVIGGKILESIKERPKLATGARWHHERYDGSGYPDGIAGDQIPEEARIIAVADAYDAMTSRRSYRSVMPQDKVRGEIARCSGTQFDPRFAEIMLYMIDEDKDYTMRETEPSVVEQ